MTNEQKLELVILQERLKVAAGAYHFSDHDAEDYHKLLKLIREFEEAHGNL